LRLRGIVERPSAALIYVKGISSLEIVETGCNRDDWLIANLALSRIDFDQSSLTLEMFPLVRGQAKGDTQWQRIMTH
jgi:hypothetical protein